MGFFKRLQPGRFLQRNAPAARSILALVPHPLAQAASLGLSLGAARPQLSRELIDPAFAAKEFVDFASGAGAAAPGNPFEIVRSKAAAGGIMPGRGFARRIDLPQRNPFERRTRRPPRINPFTGLPASRRRGRGLSSANIRTAMRVLKLVSKIYHKLPKSRCSRPAGRFGGYSHRRY